MIKYASSVLILYNEYKEEMVYCSVDEKDKISDLAESPCSSICIYI